MILNSDWFKDFQWEMQNRGQTSSAYMPGTRNPNSDTYAADTFADITRAEYRDYKDRFQPYEQKLMSLAQSEELLDEQLSRITATSKRRFDQSKANSALMNQRYGVQQNDEQRNYSNTMTDASRGLAISQAKNMSRLAATDRKTGILSGAGSTRQLANQQGG
tara:strand:- start:528 stop:1013 length:486 start_codon:yes stop_codon:yes gene_type:complete